MNYRGIFGRHLLVAAVFIGPLVVPGCNRASHPDDQAAVYQALDQHNLSSVTVSQDRRSGVITLNGIVADQDRKARAETLAKQAAPDYTISNRIRVESTGISTSQNNQSADNAIENQYKQTIEAARNLQHQQIQYSADNGTLTLKGFVATEAEKKEAEYLAKKVPQVQHVVNEIEVIHAKSSRAAS